MTLLGLVVALVVIGIVVGLLLWALQQLPGDPAIKNTIRVVVIVIVVLVVVLWLLGAISDGEFGVLNRRLW